ncbi:MAG TPA: hypothetical protein VE780_05655, partial [Thermoleophilaceae bacterium]|nr:hypothetical protein [Thermoleophilaceae bacterium]
MQEKVVEEEVAEPEAADMPGRSSDSASAECALTGDSSGTPSNDRGRLLTNAIASAKEGDVSALHFIYVRYADDVQGYVRSIVRDRH